MRKILDQKFWSQGTPLGSPIETPKTRPGFPEPGFATSNPNPGFAMDKPGSCNDVTVI